MNVSNISVTLRNEKFVVQVFYNDSLFSKERVYPNYREAVDTGVTLAEFYRCPISISGAVFQVE